MALHGIRDQVQAYKSSGTQQSKPKKGKGPADLAKALGVTEEQLKKMSPKEVENRAKKNHIDLRDYGRPERPPQQQGPQRNSSPNSVF